MSIEEMTAELLSRAKAIKSDCESASIKYSTEFGWTSYVHWDGGCESSDICDANETPQAAVEDCLENLRALKDPDLALILGLSEAA